MKPRQQRTLFVVIVLAGVAIAATLVFMAIGENMLYFYSPTQVLAGEAPNSRSIRVGGLVREGSVRRESGNLEVQFDLTDNVKTMTVAYSGILPDLFREGQGIVAIGQLRADGVLVADEVLAKHDENYMPPEVADALRIAREGGQMASNPHADAGATNQ